MLEKHSDMICFDLIVFGNNTIPNMYENRYKLCYHIEDDFWILNKKEA